MTNKFTYDHIWGSGFTTYPWHTDVSYDKDTDILTVRIGDDDEWTYGYLTSADLWSAYQKLLREGKVHFSSNSHSGDYEDIDLDAGDADCIVQQAVLGEVVFG